MMKKLISFFSFLAIAGAAWAQAPNVNLGLDTLGCTSIVLNAGNAGSTYLWSTGATTQKLTVTASGTYFVKATNANGFDSDTIVVTILNQAKPAVSLGADKTSCGLDVNLTPGSTYAGYVWSTGSTGSFIQTNVSGTYWVQVVDTFGCWNIDTVKVTINTPPKAGLGADRAECGSVILTAGGTSRLWSNGSTAPTLNVTTSGTYSVSVTDAATGCSDADTVVLTIMPKFQLTNAGDYFPCGSLTLTPTLSIIVPGAQFFWKDGVTGSPRTFTQTGNYYLIVTDAKQACMDSGLYQLQVFPVPVVALGNDTTVCGTSFSINAGNSGSSFLWSPGAASTQQLTVISTGTYSVEVTNGFNCKAKDTIKVTFPPALTASFAQNKACDSLLLSPTTNITPASYLWDNGSQQAGRWVKTSGTYSVTLQHPNGCASISPSVTVTIDTKPTVNFTSTVTGGSVAFTNGSSANATSYDWSFGDGYTSTQQNPTHIYGAVGTFTVQLTATNNCGSTFITKNVTPNVKTSIEANTLGDLRLANLSDGKYRLMIEGANATQVAVHVLDMQGKTLHAERVAISGGAAEVLLDGSSYPAGLYFVRLLTETGSSTLRMVVE